MSYSSKQSLLQMLISSYRSLVIDNHPEVWHANITMSWLKKQKRDSNGRLQQGSESEVTIEKKKMKLDMKQVISFHNKTFTWTMTGEGRGQRWTEGLQEDGQAVFMSALVQPVDRKPETSRSVQVKPSTVPSVKSMNHWPWTRTRSASAAVLGWTAAWGSPQRTLCPVLTELQGAGQRWSFLLAAKQQSELSRQETGSAWDNTSWRGFGAQLHFSGTKEGSSRTSSFLHTAGRTRSAAARSSSFIKANMAAIRAVLCHLAVAIHRHIEDLVIDYSIQT